MYDYKVNFLVVYRDMFISLEKKKYVGYFDYRVLRNKFYCFWDKIWFFFIGNFFDLKCGVCLI